MWRKLAVVPLLIIPIACVAFLVKQGYIKVGWLDRPEEPPVPAIVETLEIASTNTGKTYTVSVQLPHDYKDNTQNYPVIFAPSDRQDLLDYTTIVGPLVKKKKIVDVIIVNVGPGRLSGSQPAPRAPEAGRGIFGGGGAARGAAGARWLEDAHRSQQQFAGQKPTGGKAEAFVQFFEKELIPKIESQYRTDPARRTLAGHGYGGVFALETALTHPNLFTNYIVMAPKVEFASMAPVKLAEETVRGDFDPPVHMFAVIGADDNPLHMKGYQRLVEVMKSKKYAKFDFKNEILVSNDHRTIVLSGMQSALTALFKP